MSSSVSIGKVNNLSCNGSCPICLEDKQEFQTLECSHQFCKSCLGRWKRENVTCPVCRELIVPEKNEKKYDKFFYNRVYHNEKFFKVLVCLMEMKKKKEEEFYEGKKRRIIKEIVDEKVLEFYQNFKTELYRYRTMVNFNKKCTFFWKKKLESSRVMETVLQIRTKLKIEMISRLENMEFPELAALEEQYINEKLENCQNKNLRLELLSDERFLNRNEILHLFKKETLDIIISSNNNDWFFQLVKRYNNNPYTDCYIHCCPAEIDPSIDVAISIDELDEDCDSQFEDFYDAFIDFMDIDFVRNDYIQNHFQKDLEMFEKLQEKYNNEPFGLVASQCYPILKKEQNFPKIIHKGKWRRMQKLL